MPDPSLIKRHWPFWEMFAKLHNLDLRKADWERLPNDRKLIEDLYVALWESYDYLSERSSEMW